MIVTFLSKSQRCDILGKVLRTKLIFLIMPNIKAAAKAWRQNLKRRAKNLKSKSSVKKLVKMAREQLSAKNREQAMVTVKAAIKALDRAAQKSVIKKNTASRKKSRLMKKLNLLK